MSEPKVAVTCPMPGWEPWTRRWFKCYQDFTYANKICIISSENQPFLEEVKKEYPFVHTIPFTFYRPPWNKNRVFAICKGREVIRRFVCDHPDITDLLMIDSDVWTPPDTIQKMLYKANLYYSRMVGLIACMTRAVCESTSFMTGVCRRDPSIYLEELDWIERQLKFYNDWRPEVLHKTPVFTIHSFNCSWARHNDMPMGIY